MNFTAADLDGLMEFAEAQWDEGVAGGVVLRDGERNLKERPLGAGAGGCGRSGASLSESHMGEVGGEVGGGGESQFFPDERGAGEADAAFGDDLPPARRR